MVRSSFGVWATSHGRRGAATHGLPALELMQKIELAKKGQTRAVHDTTAGFVENGPWTGASHRVFLFASSREKPSHAKREGRSSGSGLRYSIKGAASGLWCQAFVIPLHALRGQAFAIRSKGRLPDFEPGLRSSVRHGTRPGISTTCRWIAYTWPLTRSIS